MQQGLVALLPEAALWPPMERWWGFRPGTPDNMPLLGPGPIEGVWLATGHHRNGVLLAAITAELIAEAITAAGQGSGTSAALLAPFRWNRPQPAAPGGHRPPAARASP